MSEFHQKIRHDAPNLFRFTFHLTILPQSPQIYTKHLYKRKYHIYGQGYRKIRYFAYHFQYVKDESVHDIKPLAMVRSDQEKILNYFLEQKEIDNPKKMQLAKYDQMI